MSGDSAMEDEYEELRLLKEALWYARWSVAFSIASFVVEVVAFVELLRDKFSTVVSLMALAIVVYLFARYLGTKSKRLRYQADEVSDD